MPPWKKTGAVSAHCSILSKGYLPRPSFSVHLESMPKSANPTHLSYIDCYCFIFSVLIFCPGNYFPSTANSYPWKGDFLEVHKSHPSVYKDQVSPRNGKWFPQRKEQPMIQVAQLICPVVSTGPSSLTFQDTEKVSSFISFLFSELWSGKCKKIFWKYLPIKHKGSDVFYLILHSEMGSFFAF